MIFWSVSILLMVIAAAMLAPSLLSQRKTQQSDQRTQNIEIAREQMRDLEVAMENNEIDSETFENAKVELERTLMDDISDTEEAPRSNANKNIGRMTLFALIATIPLLTTLLYFQIGTPELIDAKQGLESQQAGNQHNQNSQISDMVAGMKQKLKENPDDGDGWYLLARTYMYIKDYPNAQKAFARAYQFFPDDVAVILNYADAMIMSNNGEFNTTSKALVKKALELEPTSTTALWLAGMIASDEGDYQRALKLWRLLKRQLEGDPQQAQVISMIAKLEKHLGIEPTTEKTKSQDSGSAVAVSVTVTISDEIKAQLNDVKKVFIYAKAVNGPRFPIAAVQVESNQLPTEVVLDDQSAVMSSAKISDFENITIGAHISKSGTAIATTGDFVAQPVKWSRSSGVKVNLLINQIIE